MAVGGKSSNAKSTAPKRDFSTAIVERKSHRVPNRLLDNEAENDDNSIVPLNMETMDSLQLFEGDKILIKGNRKKKGKRIMETHIVDPSKSNVIYVGRIPHGFYEKQMREFFEQFGNISKLRISRNKTTGRSKHYGFIQFELPEVAAIVAESMHNYLLFESMLQVKLVPVDKLHPKLWVGANREYRVGKFQMWQKMQHNKVRTPSEQKRQLQGLMKKDKQRRENLKAAGIDFDFPDIRDLLPARPKKINFAE